MEKTLFAKTAKTTKAVAFAQWVYLLPLKEPIYQVVFITSQAGSALIAEESPDFISNKKSSILETALLG